MIIISCMLASVFLTYFIQESSMKIRQARALIFCKTLIHLYKIWNKKVHILRNKWIIKYMTIAKKSIKKFYSRAIFSFTQNLSQKLLLTQLKFPNTYEKFSYWCLKTQPTKYSQHYPKSAYLTKIIKNFISKKVSYREVCRKKELIHIN